MNRQFFFDANLIGVARELEKVHHSILYPGHNDWPLAQDVDDETWLQLVGDRGWCAILRDKRIRYRTTERAALVRHRTRVVVITTTANLTIAENVKLLERYWPEIESTLMKPPAMYHLTSTSLREMLRY